MFEQNLGEIKSEYNINVRYSIFHALWLDMIDF